MSLTHGRFEKFYFALTVQRSQPKPLKLHYLHKALASVSFLNLLQQGFCETAVKVGFYVSPANLHSPWVCQDSGDRNRSNFIYLLFLQMSHHVNPCHLISMSATTNGNPGQRWERHRLHLFPREKKEGVRLMLDSLFLLYKQTNQKKVPMMSWQSFID